MGHEPHPFVPTCMIAIEFTIHPQFMFLQFLAPSYCVLYTVLQSYEIKSPPWTILWFRILGIFSVENIARLGVFMFQTTDNSQLCIDSQHSSQ
jgi:hypothetical protein